jgi:hypothetical protein
MVGGSGFNYLAVLGVLLHQGLLTVIGFRMGYGWRSLAGAWLLWMALIVFHHFGFYKIAAETGTAFNGPWFLSNSIVACAGYSGFLILITFAVGGLRKAALQPQGALHAQS